MTQNDLEQKVDAADAEVEALEADTDAEKETTDWKTKYEEAVGGRKRAETALERLRVQRKAEAIVEKQSKTGELSETQLDYLELKGISEDDDLKIIERHVQRTGETVREAIKDDYVIAKLEANKEKREVKDGTPSSTKRTGAGQTSDVAQALARFEQTGVLPTDFELATKVTNKIADRGVGKPSWHK